MSEKNPQAKEMTPQDADRLAKAYEDWIVARDATSLGGGTPAQKELYDNTPRVAGRPLWVSQLTESERKLFEEAVKRRTES